MRNFNGYFRKHVTYDNTKIHKKTGLYPLSIKPIFKKATGVGSDRTPSLFRIITLSREFLIAYR